MLRGIVGERGMVLGIACGVIRGEFGVVADEFETRLDLLAEFDALLLGFVLELTPVPVESVVRPARHDVEVRVHHDLAGGGAVGEVEVEAVGVKSVAERGADARAHVEHAASGGFRDGGGAGVVFLRDDEDVSEVDGEEVEEGEDEVVFVDFHGRDFAVDDAAEQAVFHNERVPFGVDYSML